MKADSAVPPAVIVPLLTIAPCPRSETASRVAVIVPLFSNRLKVISATAKVPALSSVDAIEPALTTLGEPPAWKSPVRICPAPVRAARFTSVPAPPTSSVPGATKPVPSVAVTPAFGFSDNRSKLVGRTNGATSVPSFAKRARTVSMPSPPSMIPLMPY